MQWPLARLRRKGTTRSLASFASAWRGTVTIFQKRSLPKSQRSATASRIVWPASNFSLAEAEAIGRQPSAATQITGAVNLPLFLLEGVAILAEVFALLVLFLGR